MRNLVYDVRRYYHTVAPFLEAELAGRGDGRLWRRIGRDHAAGTILELGCGSGRVTELLASSGARVAGIDVCPELLELASRRLWSTAGFQRADPKPRTQNPEPNVQLVLMDMRELAFRARFDAVVAPDDPFSHLLAGADRDRALASLARLLLPGGRLILDALWFRPEDEGRMGAGLLVDHDIVRDGGQLRVTERWQCDPRSHRCSTEFQYSQDAGEPTSARFEARYWTAAELRRRLAAACLRITATWGGFDRELWDEQRSTHLIVEAKLDSDLAG